MKISFLMTLLLAASAFAQSGPGRDGPPRDGPGREGRLERGPDGPGGQRGPGLGGPQHPMMAQIEMMRAWLELIDRYVRMSKDPVSAGVAAVVSADDLMRGKQPSQAIEYFNKVLPEVKNETVQRAIRLQLIELYGKNNEPDKALEEIRKLMIEAPAKPEATAHP